MNNSPLAWLPYDIVNVDPLEPQRKGFIGRAAAMRINGTECIVMTRGAVDLEAIGHDLVGPAFDIGQHYQVTLIQSDGVEVFLPETPEELPINLPPPEEEVKPLIPEEAPKPTSNVIYVSPGDLPEVQPTQAELDDASHRAEFERDEDDKATQAIIDLDEERAHGDSENEAIAQADANLDIDLEVPDRNGDADGPSSTGREGPTEDDEL